MNLAKNYHQENLVLIENRNNNKRKPVLVLVMKKIYFLKNHLQDNNLNRNK